jgi:hypothetical protein
MADKFTLEFSIDDFGSIYHTSMRSFYSEQSDRFEWNNAEQFGKKYNDQIDLQSENIEISNTTYDKGWYMYWLGTNALNMLVAEKILLASGYKVYRLWDMVENPEPEWCLLTDFGSNWEKSND